MIQIMKMTRQIVATSAIVVGLASWAAPVLVPMPKHMRLTGGKYAALATSSGDIDVRETRDATLPPEGYRLVVTTCGVSVTSSDAAGAFYARQTLKQLAGCGALGTIPSTNMLPCVEIEDSPAYRWRGVLLDESRHFFGKENVKRILDLMAYHKLNIFHWHLTDDDGWRLDIPAFPELTKRGSVRPNSWKRGGKPHKVNGQTIIDRNTEKYGPYYYTADDVREILAYATERHITVMPEIELPGHSGGALIAYPQLACRPNGVRERIWNLGYCNNPDVYCVGNDETIKFLEKVLDYVCELFPSKIIHIGGDECPRTRWKECPKCLARMKAEGLKDVNDLQAWITRHFAAYLEKKGRRIMGWDEILSGDVPKSAIGMSWRESAANGAGDKLTTGAEGAARGHDMVMSPHTLCYYDYRQGIPDDPFQYIGGNIPLKKAYSFDPCAGVSQEARAHVLGGQCNNWSEFTWNEHDLAWKMWPRTCAMAEVLWTAPESRDFNDFSKRMETHRKRLIADGVNCAPLQ